LLQVERLGDDSILFVVIFQIQCVTGVSGVGKSSLIVRFLRGEFYQLKEATFGSFENLLFHHFLNLNAMFFSIFLFLVDPEDRHQILVAHNNETHLLEILDTGGDSDTFRKCAKTVFGPLSCHL
jgi:GTPase SAR1 family protein